MISVCFAVYSIQGVKLNNERTKFCQLCGYTLKIRLLNFFHETIFFIWSTMSFFSHLLPCKCHMHSQFLSPLILTILQKGGRWGVGGEEFFWRERVMGKSGSSFGVCFRVFRDTNYKINTTTFIWLTIYVQTERYF